MEPKTMFKIMFYGILIAVVLIFSVPQIEIMIEQNYYEERVDPPKNNAYAILDQDIAFIKNHLTDNFLAESKNDLIKIFFTTINSGINEFTFYCTRKYSQCFDDLEKITSEFTHFNSFIHPYNNYKYVSINYDTQGKIDLEVTRLYSSSDIKLIDERINEIWDTVVKNNMTEKQKIRAIHDYILTISTYDKERADAITNNADYFVGNNSHKANGPLIDKKAICSGYSDAMALFLFKMGIPNYHIANETHIWNYLKINNNWYHLDLTWNNPSTEDGDSIIITNYFLIATDELNRINGGVHHYDTEIYAEAK